MKYTPIAILMIACCMTTCGRVSSGDLEGTYEGNYGGGIEVLELKADGSFTQTFTKSGAVVYVGTGKWYFMPRNTYRSYDAVRFEPWVTAEDHASYSSMMAPWLSVEQVIEFGEQPYFVRRR